MFRTIWSRIGAIWCTLTHDSLMWPAHGYYGCRTCGRRYAAFAEMPMPNRPELEIKRVTAIRPGISVGRVDSQERSLTYQPQAE